MPSKLKTAIEFTKHILTTGAISQTSEKTEEEITTKLSESSKIVVEFGMGHGNITEVILRKLPADAKLYAFEVKEKFCDVVRANIKDPRLIIINDSAENMYLHVKEPVNNFVSSMPFSFFSKELTDQILSQSIDALAPGGTFSQVLYSKSHKKKWLKHFNSITIERVLAVPVQFVFHCIK
jgi:phospholipid N-methyltransferase